MGGVATDREDGESGERGGGKWRAEAGVQREVGAEGRCKLM